MLTGDDLFVAPPESVPPHMKRMSISEKQKFQTQERSLAELPHEKRKTIFNLKQNYPYGQPSVLLPSFTRTTTKLWSRTHSRCMTADEQFFSMGIPTKHLASKCCERGEHAALLELPSRVFSEAEKAALAGGTMHTQVMCAVLLHVVRSPEVRPRRDKAWQVCRDGGAWSRGNSTLFD